MSMIVSQFLMLLVLLLTSSLSLALTEGVKKLVTYETKSNSAGLRSDQLIMLSHLEIPLSLVGVDFALHLDPLIAQSLVFKKADQQYVRWILNPEDTKWGDELIKSFQEKGIHLQPQSYFIGYQTASRSYIAEDPMTGAQFSVKSSTNVTGGSWRDKKQPVGEAIDARLLSDFLTDQNKKLPFKNFIFMDEPAILKLDAIDQAVVIRDIGEIKKANQKNSYLPGFSALHETTGSEIAKLNGSDNPYEFWTKNYIQVAGQALGELAARTGIQFDSPHSQNFLIELDANSKPTGRLVLRDMSDLYIDKTVMQAIQGENSEILSKFTQKENVLGHIAAAFGPLHGNQKPSWVSEEQYSKWQEVFFSEFERSFLDTSGYELSVLKTTKRQSGDYFMTRYSLSTDKSFDGYYEMLRTKGYIKNINLKMSCQTIMLQAIGY